jgi:hypothetical protein
VSDRPYAARPSYFQQPVSGRAVSPLDRDERLQDVLAAIDAHAALLERDSTPDREALADEIDELDELLPPRADLLAALARMRTAIAPLPGQKPTSPDEARERLQSMTDLIRLRTR